VCSVGDVDGDTSDATHYNHKYHHKHQSSLCVHNSHRFCGELPPCKHACMSYMYMGDGREEVDGRYERWFNFTVINILVALH